MAEPRDIAGLVLAGGRSSRFGRDKAAVILAGRPLLAWSVANLETVTRRIAVSAGPGSNGAALAATLGFVAVADDPASPSGPLAGVGAGLTWAAAVGCAWLVTLPCDTPLVGEAVLRRLLAVGGPAYAETADGAQALVAVWPTSAGPALARKLAAGDHPSVRAALDAAGAAAVRFDDAMPFRNLNTEADLAALAAQLAG